MHEILSQIAQTWGLILFIVAFILVLFYALAPGKRQEFERASHIPLNDEEPDDGGK